MTISIQEGRTALVFWNPETGIVKVKYWIDGTILEWADECHTLEEGHKLADQFMRGNTK